MEKEIGKTIEKYFKIEWMRLNMYYAEDKYACFPMLVFRFDLKESELRIKKLQSCVNAFKGINKWSLFISPLSNKNNYILSLKILEDIQNEYSTLEREKYNLIEILGETEYKRLCDEAILDIPFLRKQIELLTK